MDASFTQREIDDGGFAAHIEPLGRAVQQARDAASVSHNDGLSPKAA